MMNKQDITPLYFVVCPALVLFVANQTCSVHHVPTKAIYHILSCKVDTNDRVALSYVRVKNKLELKS